MWVKIFKNRGIRVTGREVHYESRDSQGLYPLTLTPTVPTEHLLNTSPKEVRVHLASALSTAKQVVRNARVEKPVKQITPVEKLPPSVPEETLSNLARVYPREDMSVLEKWHNRCGHASVKALKKMGIPELQGKKIPDKYRCEGCIKGKIHRMAHKEMHDQPKTTYKPGQCIATDLMGPYAKSMEGSRYAQLYKCATSKFRWLCTLTSKDLTNQATALVLKDAKARSGRNVKFLKTDGDGMFRSKQFEDLSKEYGFIHEKAAPHDHNSNAMIERDIRTATALQNCGAPSQFWADAMHHFIFTKNVLPVETKAPQKLLNLQGEKFNMDYLVAFGTKCTCYVPVARREGGKQPNQRKAFDGMVIGYVRDMPAYKIYDFESRKKREVSFTMTFIHEGYYPYKSIPEKDDVPLTFFPTREAALDQNEWKRYGYDQAEENEAWHQRETWERTLSSDPAVDYRPWWSLMQSAPESPGVPVEKLKTVDLKENSESPLRFKPGGSGTFTLSEDEIAQLLRQLHVSDHVDEKSVVSGDEKQPQFLLQQPNSDCANTPSQPGNDGFTLVDEAQMRKERGLGFTIPDYQKAQSAYIPPTGASLPDGIQSAQMGFEEKSTPSIEQTQSAEPKTWAERLAPVKGRKMVVYNLPKMRDKKLRSDVIPGKPPVVSAVLVYNVKTDTLHYKNDVEGERINPEVFFMDKPVGIPPPKTLGEARKSAWWDG